MNNYHNIINWKSYYKNEQVTDYNIRNTYCVNLFNTNDINMKGDNQINYLNSYLGELTMMYYIWKNNLKSDYIIISQYRRDITYIDYDNLDNKKIQVTCLWFENHNVKLKDRILADRDPSGLIKETLWKYLKEHYNLSNENLENIKNKTSYICMAGFIFAMKWEIYCKLCELIFGFLNTLFPNEEWKNIDTIIKFRDEQKKLYYEYNKLDNNEDQSLWSVYDDNRYLTFILEDIVSIILGQFFEIFQNEKYYNETYIYTEVNKYNTIFDISKFYKINIKCNPCNIYIKCLDDDSYNNFNHFATVNHWEFNKIKILKKDEICYNKVIKLNINEYIDVDEPIDLYMNKYNIKNINNI